jgi:FKBP-type peptidyl-prolyl cis-trans isomerase FklB
MIPALQQQRLVNGERYMMRSMRIATLVGIASLATAAGMGVCAQEPLKLDDETARINYSLGYQIGGDFKHQGIELNAEAVVKGMQDALSGSEPLMPQPEMNATLVELKRKVVAAQQAKRREAEIEKVAAGKKYLEENAKKPGVVTTPSGLQYKIIEAGSGKTPGPTDSVTVNYRGTLINGNEFDSSYDKGKPVTFPLNGVIKGWTEGLQLVKEGGKIQLVIPSELAYGKRGPLANQTLVFDVELISIGGNKPGEASRGAQSQGK